MPNAIKIARERKNIGSHDELARILMETHPDVFTFNDSRYLSKLIGELDRHDASHWTKRWDGLQCLVDFLEITIDDLELQRKTAHLIFAPPAFPDFPPLSLVREDIWTIAEAKQIANKAPVETNRYQVKPTLDFWLKPDAIGVGPHQTQWLCVPDAVEFDLLTRWLDAVSRHRVRFKKTITDALTDHLEEVHHHRAVILVINNEETAENVKLLMQHRQGAPLLIISPYSPPPLDSNPRPQRARSKRSVRLQFESWLWMLSPNWRETLLQWIDARFQQKNKLEHYFSSGGVLKLLRKFDPSGQWITSVEDLLVLAQAVSEFGELELDKSLDSDIDFSELMKRLFSQDESKLALVERLVRARWTSWHLPWTGSLTEADWAALAEGVCRLDVLIAQFVKGSADRYDFKRPIVARLLLRSYLVRQLIQGNAAAWTPACFDEQRRPLLDAALDALSIAELENVAVQLHPRLAQLDHLGVAEALFAAAGRRLVRGEAIRNTLPNLLVAVAHRLRPENDALIPYSRSMASAAASVEWLSICWAWSLHTQHDGAMRPSWQFPGWNKALPQRVAKYLDSYGASYSAFSWEREPLHMRAFLEVVRRWLATLKDAPQYDNMPPVFMAALLAEAAKNRRPAEPGWWPAVIGNPGAEQALLDVVASRTPSDHAVALAWWPSLVAYRRGQADRAATFTKIGDDLFTRYPEDHHYSPLLAWVMEQLEDDAALALTSLAKADLVFLTRHPRLLSAPFKRELLKAIPAMQDFNLSVFDVPGLLHRFGPETSDEVEMLLDHSQLGMQAAHHLWDWAPRKATALLSQPQLMPVAIKNLLIASPPAALGPALAALAVQMALFTPDERLAWAKDRLPDARQHAPALLQFMMSPQLSAVT
jgi:hypothetical protein